VIAGEMLGLKAIFMDAGSGADFCVSDAMIKAVKMNTQLPIIVGGGIKSIQGIELAHKAGADVVVIGNKIEENIDFLLDIKSYLVHQIEKNVPHEN
jgi:putative glycerol-1-phosphate prenyltransferase